MVIPEPPVAWQRIKSLGPGFLWMVSAAGSGELLFTPRIGAQYGYALLWAVLAAVTLKWFINREIGRFAVCTGVSVIEGFAKLPGARHWVLWLILVPQAFVAVTAIAGLAGSAATALILLFPGDIRFWMIAVTISCVALVLWGRYKGVERAATFIATALAVASIAAAVTVGPNFASFFEGLSPSIPPSIDYKEVLPWLGFMLSGAAGLMWYSYWIPQKGYGAAKAAAHSGKAVSVNALSRQDQLRLRGWIRQMSLDCTVAVVGTLIVTLAFLILGTELLQPRNLVPEENRVAQTLGRLLGEIWGPVGFWFMIIAVFVGFWDTVLSDQDGHSRLFANTTRILTSRFRNEARLQRVFAVTLVTAVPIVLYLAIGQPVELLKIAGAIEAAHIPVVGILVLILNRRTLPSALQPSRLSFAATSAAAVFFAAFAILYIANY